MNNNNNIDNIIFSGDGRGLNFSTFIGLLAHMYIIDGVNRLTKADLLRRIRGDALDVVAGLAHETTLDDVIRVLSENYAVGETDQLNEVMKLAETRFPSLEMAIAKFIAKTARTEMFNEKTKIMLFTKVIGIELGYEVKKNAPETLSRAVELARTIENSTIDMVGRSMYLGQMTNRLQQDYGGYFQNDNPIMTTSTFINQNQMQTPMLPQPIYTPININPYTPQLQGMNNGFTIQTPMANNGFVPQTPGTPYSTPAAVNAINGNRITCNYCKKLGHRATECYKKRNNERRNEVRTIEVEEETVNAIGSNNISATLLVNGKYVRGLVDTGSSITLLWRSIAEKLQLKINEAENTAKSASTHKIKIIGYAHAEIKIGKLVGNCKIDIVEDGETTMDCIFGLNLINKLDLIIDTSSMKLFNKQYGIGVKLYYREFNKTICAIDYNYLNKLSPDVGELIKKYECIFESKLKKPGLITDIKHCINLVDENISAYTPAYKTSPSDKEFIEAYIKDALDRGIIERSKSSKYGAPIVLNKKNGKTRFCVNYKKLNSITVKDRYPLPLISDCWYYLRNAKVFSKLDLTQGYYQIMMNEADKEKTTFVSHIGSFQYTVMPFGLVNGPATFQRMVEELLGEKLRKTAIVFIDDFIVFSNKKEEHAKDLETIFNLFKERRVSVQIEKCEIEKEEIKFLGFKVSREGITYDGSKFIDLQALPPPANQKELMKFLGTVNYFRSFIKDFTSYTQPFFKLLKKNINFTWDKELELNRVKLLKVLAGTNVLSFPKDTMDNVIESDVSNNGIGGVMLQDGKPVCFYSRSLNDAEKKYSVTEKECLAVVECVKYFKSYINGRKVTIITDHQPLKYILTGKFTDRIVKWSMLLQEVDFQIVYRPGKENFLADTLSRYPSGNGGSLDLDIPVYTVTSVSSNEELLEFSKECIERELNKEPFCKAMREYLDNGSLPEEPGIGREILLESEFYCVMDDYLCRGTKHIQSSRKSKFTGFQIVIPKTMIVMVLKMFHECKLLGGHFGFIKTLNKIKERFYWRGMIKDIKHYTQQCNVCLSIKRKYGKKEGLLVPMRVVSEPFHTVGVDFIGPVEFKGVKIYLLVFIDYFSKWPEVFLTQYQDAETVANILFYEIITRYGAPARLVSDRGAVFLSAVVSGINKIFGTKKINSTAYHPQLDGQTENFNSTLIRMLKSFINEELYGNWSELLRCVLFTYRITPHVSTGFSPFFLLYNRQPRLPVDTSLKANFYSNRLILDFANDIAQSIQNNVKRARWFAEQKLEKSKENQEVYYNKGRVPTQIGEGDYVYLHTPYVANGSDVPKKFYRPWTGPFKVIKKKSEVNFELEMGNSLAHRIVNVNRLKKVIN
ncbi:hypothetical protein ACTFIU_005666 [Dictyostelium citrinum]